MQMKCSRYFHSCIRVLIGTQHFAPFALRFLVGFVVSQLSDLDGDFIDLTYYRWESHPGLFILRPASCFGGI